MKQDQGAGRSSIAGDAVLDPMGIFAGAEANREKDPELRRCLELGGTLDGCEGVGAIEGMASVLMPFVEKPDPNAPPPVAGVVLVGDYHSTSQLPSLSFGNGSATIQDCGSLVRQDHDYTLRKSGNTVQFVLANEPEPIVVTMQPDGTLSVRVLSSSKEASLRATPLRPRRSWWMALPLQRRDTTATVPAAPARPFPTTPEDRTLHHRLHGLHASQARSSA